MKNRFHRKIQVNKQSKNLKFFFILKTMAKMLNFGGTYKRQNSMKQKQKHKSDLKSTFFQGFLETDKINHKDLLNLLEVLAVVVFFLHHFFYHAYYTPIPKKIEEEELNLWLFFL